MSSLRRAAMLNRLPHMPTISPYADDAGDDEENEEEEENDSLGDLPSMGPPRS